MEAEAEKLKVLQSEVEKQMSMGESMSSVINIKSKSSFIFSPNWTTTISHPWREGRCWQSLHLCGPGKTLAELIEHQNRILTQVDYTATAEELEQHFHGCGAVNRVTILCDKFSGSPKVNCARKSLDMTNYPKKGFAYIEFAEKESVDASMALEGSMFKGRQIKGICQNCYFLV